MPQSGVGSMQGSTEGCLPLKVVFPWRLSSPESHLPPKLFFHWRLFFTEGRFPPKVVFYLRSSSTKGRLPPMVVFQQRSSSTKGYLPPTIIPLFILYLWEQSTYQISASYLQCMMLDAWCMMHDAWCNTLDDLIFVRAVNIPKLNLIPFLQNKRNGHASCLKNVGAEGWEEDPQTC